MSQWVCYKCSREMEEVDDIKIAYGDMELPDSEGLRCPECGKEYLTEELVLGELVSAEEILQSK